VWDSLHDWTPFNRFHSASLSIDDQCWPTVFAEFACFVAETSLSLKRRAAELAMDQEKLWNAKWSDKASFERFHGDPDDCRFCLYPKYPQLINDHTRQLHVTPVGNSDILAISLLGG
jgi:hypothetical protein